MLNGAGGLNADGLSLDLQFAADKTMTARKGPSPVFTRGSTGTFVGSNGLIQTAAVNDPRFDHDPTTLASRGLLIEESRTNICLQSENFGTTWAAAGCAVSVNTAVAPDGNTTADSVNITNASGHFLQQNIAVSASTAYTFSFWVKRGTATALSYSVFNNTAGNNIVASTSYYSQTSSAWSRVSFTFTTPVGCTSIAVYILRDGGSTGTVLLWGAQVEAGSFATSYIPTTAGTLARSADVCSITGTDFSSFYNQSEGTISYKASTARPGNSVVVYSVSDGTISNIINSCPGSASFNILRLGASEVSLNHGTFTTGVAASQASAYKLNNFASSKNGGTVLVDSTGTPPSVSQISLGSQNVEPERINGHIAYFRYYKKRLPNAKLVTLTT